MPTNTLQPITIFISSPSDVAKEREIAVRVVNRLNTLSHISSRFVLRPLDYISEVPAVVGDKPQRTVDRYMKEASQSDIVICILWSKMGTPVIDETGKEYESGTAYEFETAYQARKTTGKPSILLYQGKKPYPTTVDFTQAEKVRTFFKRFEGKDADFDGLYGSYDTDTAFEERLFRDLDKIISQDFAPPKAETTAPPTTQPRVNDTEIRQRYLKGLSEYVNNYLEHSIHRVVDETIQRTVFIDLSLDRKLDATYRPWTLEGLGTTSGPKHFDTFDQAFEAYQRRVLLLGDPGAGKTTTLFEMAQQTIQSAIADPNKPIPVLLNLARWQEDVEALDEEEEKETEAKTKSSLLPPLAAHRNPKNTQRGLSFEQWLVQMLADPQRTNVPEAVALAWVTEGRIALFLDGLDEVFKRGRTGLGDVDVKQQGYLVRLINDYLARQRDIQVIVCCRLLDYERLQPNEQTRLALNGAVSLQPPTERQIHDYLTRADAIALRDALPDDAELMKLARTPLTLSMMAIAYREATPTKTPARRTFSERRAELFDKYTERMMQYAALRAKADPALHPASPVFRPHTNTLYSKEQTYRYLGWLATRMAERSQTLFPSSHLKNLYTFLGQKDTEERTIWEIVSLVNALAVGLFAVLLTIVGMLLAQASLPATLITALASGAISFASALLSVFVLRGLVNVSSTEPQSKLSDQIISWGGLILWLLSMGVFLGSLPVTLWADRPLRLLNLFFYIAPDGSGLQNIALPDRTVSITVGLPLASIIFAVLVTAFLIALIVKDDSKNDNSLSWSETALIVAIGLGAGAVIGLALLVAVTALGQSAAFVVGGILLGGLAGVIGERMIFYTVGFTAETLLAAAIGGIVAGAWGALAGMPLAVFLHFWLTDSSGFPKWIESLTNTIENRIMPGVVDFVETYFTNPLALLCLLKSNALSSKPEQFLRYSTGALLLKQSGADYEFYHRLLREHFAIASARGRLDNPYRWFAERYLKSKDYAAALDAFDRAVEDNPGDPAALAGRAETYRAMSRLPDALENMTRAIRLDDHYYSLLLKWADDYKYRTSPSDNLAIYSRALEIKPQDASVYSQRATTYTNMKGYDEALIDLNRAIELEPRQVKYFANRANLYSLMQREEEALADYTRAIELEPKAADRYKYRAYHHAQLGHQDEALTDFTQAIKLDTKNADRYTNRADYYGGLGRVDEALADFTQAIKLNSKNADRYTNRANYYVELGRVDEALLDFTQAIKLDSKNADRYKNRADYYGQIQRPDEALLDFTQAIKLDSKNADRYTIRAAYYAQIQRPDEALADYNRALEFSETYERFSVWLQRGDLYRQIQRYDEALADYEQAIADIFSDTIKARQRRNELLRELGRPVPDDEPQRLRNPFSEDSEE